MAGTAVPATALSALVLLSRLPLATRRLANWDAVQFALGMARFDVVHHQPHPPGYPGYIALARLLEPVAGDANTALVWLSIAGECAGVVLCYLFARSLFGEVAARISAIALVVSPLFWYYGEVGNTYALEPALAIAIAWPCWRLWQGEDRFGLVAGVAIGLAGALRPSTSVLLAPLYLLALRRHTRQVAAASLVAAAAAAAAWIVPLIVAAGGPGPYLRASLQLGGSVTSGTAVWQAGLSGLQVCAGAVVNGTLASLGGFAVPLVLGAVLGRLPWPREWMRFAAAWCAPALAVFLFVHIGQLAYVQVLTPALMLMAGPATVAAARSLGRPASPVALAAIAAVLSLAVFSLPPQGSLALRLRAHDEATDQLVALVQRSDPGSTVLVSDAAGSGSYRLAQYYLPDYRRIAVGTDRRGRVGEIYGDVYEPWRFARAVAPTWPAGTRTVVFLDRETVQELVGDPWLLRSYRLADGRRIYLWAGGPPVLSGGELWLAGPYHDRRGLS